MANLMELFVVRHYLEVAHAAVRQQYDRIKRGRPPRLDDGYLYTLALAQLLRCADEVRRLAGSRELKTEIRARTAAIPQAKDFRDILEHWPDYAAGRGKAAGRLRLASGGQWFSWKKIEPPVLQLGSRPSLTLDIRKCEEGVCRLYPALSTALGAAIRQSMGGPA